jgi:hypothetical protein
MENLSVSKIHKLVKTDKPLREFIEDEKALLAAKKRDGRSAKIVNGMNLETFLNRRYHKRLGITGKNKNADAANTPLLDILKQTSEKLKTKTDDTSSSPSNDSIEKTILGMKPVVFYSATGAVLLVTGFLIYKMVKK